MARSWFVAAGGQQDGPYAEPQFRDLITQGRVTPDTFVWCDGMPDWQRAGDVPGLFSNGAQPPAMPRPGMSQAVVGGPVELQAGIWGLLGRGLLFMIGILLVIPAPWVATGFYRYVVERLRVPGRGNIGFTGQPGDIWYVFVALGLCTYVSASVDYGFLMIPAQGFLSWLTLRWVTSHISSEGRGVPLTFTGDMWAYIGWFVLMNISFITIIGWAWVITAWTRWICRHISGSRRNISFIASGLDVLWRTLVFAIASAFIIPIPWVLGWYARWFASQFVLTPRTV
ncbi:GYF domain-containing protein [Tardiphaga sp.]|uniref:GYF domain-containing protein n=1 Tax=Tardiphaga sp. TaxID=1926292 RepID=UPI0026307A57|nr:GYF domain-containing protein [Tardiphaga sp.]MDB5616387.1 hypothetical protein [Tardiphaga sp.]